MLRRCICSPVESRIGCLSNAFFLSCPFWPDEEVSSITISPFFFHFMQFCLRCGCFIEIVHIYYLLCSRLATTTWAYFIQLSYPLQFTKCGRCYTGAPASPKCLTGLSHNHSKCRIELLVPFITLMMTSDKFIDQAVFHLPLSYSWATTTPTPPKKDELKQNTQTHEFKTPLQMYNIRRAYRQRYFNTILQVFKR